MLLPVFFGEEYIVIEKCCMIETVIRSIHTAVWADQLVSVFFSGLGCRDH